MDRRHGNRALVILIAAIVAFIVLPFLVWGDWFEQALSLEGARRWMEARGALAWVAGIGLLVADIVLPIPSTVVMSALGWMDGWFLGGMVSALGSMLSGIIAYALSRWLGRGVARRIAGEDALARAAEIFERHGGWLVAFSRWTPVLPEAVACLAGLARMRRREFLPALACGSLPLGFAFAAIGHLGQREPGWALVLSGVVPVFLWAGMAAWLHRGGRRTGK